MVDLLVLAVVFIAAFPIAVIYLLIANSNLKRRVTNLERRDINFAASTTSETIEDVAQTQSKSKAWPTQKPTLLEAEKPAIISAPVAPPKAVVFTTERVNTLVAWISENWFYAVSAVSLALAGIFLVIYGMEQGLLPPFVRIMASVLFGGALIGAGEYIRRRFGDDETSTTAYLPSTFSGAGIVTLFGAVLAARLLYGFIEPDIALVGMAVVAVLAMVLGWFYGPMLAAVGVIGAMIAPFVIGGTSDDPSMLLVYFAIVTVLGLAIDTLRRWAWVSVISLALGFGMATMLVLGTGVVLEPYFAIYCAVLAFAAVAIPVRKFAPDHAGALISLSLFARAKEEPWPEFPTRLAGGAMIAATVLITMTTFETLQTVTFWSATVVLSALILALLIWARNAPALIDLTLLPAVALVAVVAAGAPVWQPLAIAALAPEADTPFLASIIVFIGLALSGAAAWRSMQGGPAHLFVALGAAILAPALAIAMEVFWQPAQTLGNYYWALHAMVIGFAMVVMAERFAHVDGPERRERASLAILSALACIAFAMVILFSAAALTSAIAVTVVAAAWLDRRFNLPLMGLYILAGVAALGYRIVIDPGVPWARFAPLPEMLLSHAGVVVAFAVSYVLVKAAKRPRSEVLLESATFSATGVLTTLLLARTISYWSGETSLMNHWSVGLGATIWITLGLTQLRRLEMGGSLAWVRSGLGALFLVLGAIQIGLAVTLFNPLFESFHNLVLGPRVSNTLIPAYLLPALVLAFGVWWLKTVRPEIRKGLAATALALFGLWLALSIRHFWRGAVGMELPGIAQSELYSYTVALLITGAGLFYQSLAKQNAMLRKAGLLFIGLAVAKVFFLDIQGLGGLIRVFAFLFLGLALAGLAWLNRWATSRAEPLGEASKPQSVPID